MTSNAGPAGNDAVHEDDELRRHDDDDDELDADDDLEHEDEEEEESYPHTPGIRTPQDMASEIANLDDELINSQDITPDTESVDLKARNSHPATGQEIEEDTLPPEPGLEAAADVAHSDSSVDRGPSVRSSPPSTPDSSRAGSSLSIRSGLSPRRGPFERRFLARKPLGNSPGARHQSPAFLGSHSRHASSSSQISNISIEKDEEDDQQTPWEVIKWTRLKKLSSQLFSETNRRAFGNRTYLAVGASIMVGTSKGLILVFDYQQNLKSIIGQGTPAAECGSITALAISADHTTVAGGHANGFIFTWELSNPSKPFLTVPAVPRNKIWERPSDTHVEDQAVIHVGFLGTRHTALVSADDRGMAFSHLATRGLGALGRSVKSTRILGRYQLPNQPSATLKRPSSVLSFAPLPLGNVEQPTDDMGLTALLTPYLLVIVSTTPVAQTHYKVPRSKDLPAHSPMTGCLAWFPSVRLKATAPQSDVAPETSMTKLVYCWSTVLAILEIDMDPGEETDEDKRPALLFKQTRKWKSDEAIVAVQWISRSVLAVLTVTQKLIILEDNKMRVSDSCDLNARHIYHRDIYSNQLEALVGNAEQEDTTMHGVIPDAYGMSFKAYKGRLFLLDASDVTLGTLSNWADRLGALMEVGRPLQAIELAFGYYAGMTDKVTVGLPEDDETRKHLLGDKLLDLMRDSLKYTFRMDESDDLGKDIRTALGELIGPMIDASLSMNEMNFLFDEIYESYNEASCPDIFFYALEPKILEEELTTIPPTILKDMVNWYYLMGLAPRLEAIICSLRTETLDIDQVTSLCKEHYLYDALIYVWNHAVGDYVTPLMELLALADGIEDREEAEEQHSQSYETAMKMFPYMALSLTGRNFPGGEEMDPAEADKARAAIYGAVFGGDELTRSRSGTNGTNVTNYPTLRDILSFDTPEFMTTMNEAFEDAFLNGPEEHVTNGHQDGGGGHSSSGWATNRQGIVTILLQVLSGVDYKDTDRLYLDMFIARNVSKFQHQKYILLTGSTLHQVLEELCHCEDDALTEDCQLSVEYLLSVYRPPDLQKFIPLFENAGYYRVLKMTLKTSKQYGQWLQAHFADPEDQMGVFDAIVDCMRPSTGLSARQKKEIQGIVIDHVEHLAHLNVTRTALVLQDHAPDLLEPAFDKLEDDTHLQYEFLKPLLEPEDERERSWSAAFRTSHRERYVQLMCKHNPTHVSDYVSLLEANDLKLTDVLPVMERTGVIDAAVVLMAKGGSVQDAVERLVKHLGTLRTAIAGLAEESAQKDEDDSADDGLEEVAGQVDKFAKLGVWLCQGVSPSGGDARQSTARLRVEDMTESNLTAAERCWLDLVSAVVDACRAADPSTSHPQPTEQSAARASPPSPTDIALRNTVQQCFTALLTATSASAPPASSDPPRSPSRQAPQPRLLPILRLFLTRLSSSSSTSTTKSIHPILATLFASYAFESSLLSLALQLLNTDTFAHVAAAASARARGWRPSGRSCAACGLRVWGVGAGSEVYAAWAARRAAADAIRDEDAARAREEAHGTGSRADKGKGRARVHVKSESVAAVVSADGEGGERAWDAVVAFACGHVFHRACLEARAAERGGRRPAETDERGRPVFVCLSCE